MRYGLIDRCGKMRNTIGRLNGIFAARGYELHMAPRHQPRNAVQCGEPLSVVGERCCSMDQPPRRVKKRQGPRPSHFLSIHLVMSLFIDLVIDTAI
jgi:hypothetical protein